MHKLAFVQTEDHAIAHDSAHLHVTGKARFIDDMPIDSNAISLAVGGASAIGRITDIDLGAVRGAKGVIAVFTAQDIPGHQDIGAVFAGDPLLAQHQVDYIGQPVFLVAADSERLARQAAKLARIKISPADEILITPAHKDVRPVHTMQTGDAQTVLSWAPQRLEQTITIGGQEHFYLEGQVAASRLDEDGAMLVLSSTQHPSEVQKLIAQVLGWPLAKVVVQTRRMGGGFGGKETQAAQWACLSALATCLTGCSSKLRLARQDDFTLTGKRHPFTITSQAGFDPTGRLLGAKHDVQGHCGCSPDLSDAIVDRAMFHIDNAYYHPALTVTGHRRFTHTASNTAFRGFGGPQGMLACETMMESIARQVGRDPLEVRLDNLYGEHGNTTHYGQTVSDAPLKALMQSLAERAHYWQRRAMAKAHNHQTRNSDLIGLALTPVKFGISFTVTHLNQAGALIHLYTDGSVQVNHGGTEMGQGLHRKISQIVALALGVNIHRIRVTATRTDKVPNTSPTAASSGTDINGMAAQQAAGVLRQRLLSFAQKHYGPNARLAEDTLQWDGGATGFAELVQAAYMARIPLSATGYYRTPDIYYDRKSAHGQPFYYYACGAALSEVRVDRLSGEYRLRRADILHDCGNSINPALDIGQIEGGFIQGMGWLSTEELRWADDGKLLSNGPANYKIPAIGDTPPEFNVHLFNQANAKPTVGRSKAVGEPPLMLAISVFLALADAVCSLSGYSRQPRLDAPATPERVLLAMQEMMP